MTALFSAFRNYLTAADALLFGGAVVGLVLYVVLVPSHHPDVAASFELGEAQAQQTAEAFLAERGYAVDGLEVQVELRRHIDLLNGLQQALGRTATRRLLADPETGGDVPAYYWRVRYASEDEEDGEDDAPPHIVHLTQRGNVWQFERPLVEVEQTPPAVQVEHRATRQAGHRIDRAALRAAFAADTAATETAPLVDLNPFSDSLLAAELRFDSDNTRWGRLDASDASLPDTMALRTLLLADAEAPQPPGFGPEVAVALARYHLQETIWADDVLTADSAWVVAERGGRVAQVRFTRTTPLHGQEVEANVTVSAAGAVYELDVSFSEVEERSSTWRTVAGILEIATIIIIILVLVVAFFKRVSARLIDGKAAMVDGLVLGFATALMFSLFRVMNLGIGVDSFWLERAIMVGFAIVAGAAVALFTMMISGVTDSLARSVWPEKLRTSSLVRLGAFRNVYVGGSLLRGVLLAFVLLGLLAVLLAVVPEAGLRFTEDDHTRFLNARSFQPMTMNAAGTSIGVYFILVFALFGVGTFTYSLFKRAVPTVVAIVVVMVLMQGAFIELRPVGYSWLLSGLWGVALGVAFWKTNFLTSFTALFLALQVWSLNEGWLVTASPAWIDVMLLALLVLIVVVTGVAGVASGRTRRDVAEYVPDYINELTQQERLKRELEIARQVQMSFLPRRMPNVEGLDIAGMCLAALEVGGDYYDFVEVAPGKLAVMVGDVSGKGTQAAFYMTLTKGILQTLSREGLPPAEVMRRLNGLFCENAPRGTFISLIYGVFDVEARTFSFARAGHNPLILKRSPSQESELIQPTGLAIGLIAGHQFDDSIEEVTIDVRLGDVLVFYTDGFSEAMNRARDLYGDDRLADKVSDVGQRSASEILRAVTEDVHHFLEAEGRHDDMTMVVVKQVRQTNHVPAPEHRPVVAEA